MKRDDRVGQILEEMGAPGRHEEQTLEMYAFTEAFSTLSDASKGVMHSSCNISSCNISRCSRGKVV